MSTTRTKEDQANSNRQNRLVMYKTLAFWAAFGGVVPIAHFLNENILNTPKPISITFEGYQDDGVPYSGGHEEYSYEWASASDQSLHFTGFILGVVAAIGVALLFYCIARFIAEPIMYRIDLMTEEDSRLQIWSKCLIMVVVVLLYVGTLIFAGEYERYPKDEYVWLSDGDTYIRVDKDEYEKYMGRQEDDDDEKDGGAEDPGKP